MSEKKPKSPAPEKKQLLYEQMIATNPNIERKGAKVPYTSLNGHMFSFLDKDGQLSLRLPKEELAAFVNEFNTQLSVQYGTVMKEYAVVPDELFKDTSKLKGYFEISYNYVKSLKPKSTRRKK